jgi:antitoxin ParD1/3/4
MAALRKTITLTTQQDEWVKAQLEVGGYTNDSEYFRDLVRQEQKRQAQFQQLKAAVDLGVASGESELTVGDIWDKAISDAEKG